jgi:diacylglycerol O-acyltransferase
MKFLTPNDQMFLLLERRNQPMHVGGLMLIRPPEGQTQQFVEEFVELAKTHTRAVAPFNQRLTYRFGLPGWVEDTDFDIESHFFHLSLPKPGRIRELLALVSKLHSGQMDRAKPLWESYLIDGLEDGRVAVYNRIHHALVDGIAAMRMFQRSMSEDPNERGMLPFWAKASPKRQHNEPVETGTLSKLMDVLGIVKGQMGSMPTVVKEVARSVWQSRNDPDYVSVFQAPSTPMNTRISGSRRFAAQSWSLDRIKAAGKRLNVTLNDVVMAMTASALRKYLLELNELPAKPLVSMIPVSLRKDDSEGGNQVGLVLANLGTHEESPQRRLEIIHDSIETSKRRFATMTQVEIMNYLATVMGINGVNMLTGIAPSWQAFNVIVSNVPGPKNRLYFNGAHIEGVYPVSIVIDGQALNITLNSYADKLEFGLVACRRSLPSVQRLLTYLEEGLAELESMPAPA